MYRATTPIVALLDGCMNKIEIRMGVLNNMGVTTLHL